MVKTQEDMNIRPRKVFEKYLLDNREMVILGCIIEHSSIRRSPDSPPGIHGYGINKKVKSKHGVRYGFSTLYPTLWSLAEKDYIVGEHDLTGKKPRYVWRITPQGLKYFELLRDVATTVNEKIVHPSIKDLYNIQVANPLIQTNRTSRKL